MRLRGVFVFLVLFAVKAISWLFYRVESEWIGGDEDGADGWRDIRVGILLNHTSLFEPVFAVAIPCRVLWRMATDGALPIADVTLQRPVVGFFFRSLAAQVITVSRKRDATWGEMLRAVRPDALIVMMPEGRMMRAGGLDKDGREMTVRGGIADILRALPCGRMVIGYSGGLHHVQAPGDRFPRIFKTLRIRLESVDIPEYREARLADKGEKGFKRAVVRDLEQRRDASCPWDETSTRRTPQAQTTAG